MTKVVKISMISIKKLLFTNKKSSKQHNFLLSLPFGVQLKICNNSLIRDGKLVFIIAITMKILKKFVFYIFFNNFEEKLGTLISKLFLLACVRFPTKGSLGQFEWR